MHEVTVKLAAPLRKYAADSCALSLRGATVGELLAQIGATYPALGERLFNSASELNHFVGVYVGSTNIRERDGLASRVGDGDVVTLVVAVAGG